MGWISDLKWASWRHCNWSLRPSQGERQNHRGDGKATCQAVRAAKQHNSKGAQVTYTITQHIACEAPARALQREWQALLYTEESTARSPSTLSHRNTREVDRTTDWGFAGGPVAKAPSCQCTGLRSDPWSGNWSLHTSTNTWQKKKIIFFFFKRKRLRA